MLSNTLRKSVIVTNKETGEILEFSSMTDAGKYLGMSRVSRKKIFIVKYSLPKLYNLS